jgi:hypothetical protein
LKSRVTLPERSCLTTCLKRSTDFFVHPDDLVVQHYLKSGSLMAMSLKLGRCR